MKTILFVCTGNTCRSSMAETLFRDMLEKKGKELKGIRVMSAGIAAVKGQGASPQAIKVMEEMGLDLTKHRATPLTQSLVREADLILTMTESHKYAILAAEPGARGKIYTLKEYVRSEITSKLKDEGDHSCKLNCIDITDPFGQPVDMYRKCAAEIADALEKVLIKLKEDCRSDK